MDKLFCDLKTDEEKAAFFLSGRGYETGVISQAIQNDVAMAYHRCAEYQKELKALQSQDREDAERLQYMLRRVCMYQTASYGCKFEILNLPPHFGDCEPDPIPPFLAAIDHARRAEGDGE